MATLFETMTTSPNGSLSTTLRPSLNDPPVMLVGTAQPNEDQNSATTVTAISTVPAHPKIMSVGRALKRPITERRVTTTIVTVMIGTATMPCVRSPTATMRND